MKEGIERILQVTSEVCDIEVERILSPSRSVPLPQVRGLFWYALRKAYGYTNANIAELTSSEDFNFTPAGVGMAIVRVINSIHTDIVWKRRWMKLVEQLNLNETINRDNSIAMTMTVPRGWKDKVKIDIKERIG